MSTTIDKFDVNVHNLYAIRQMQVEETNRQLRLDQATGVQAHIQVLDIFPKPNEVDILLGIAALATPWALFFPPVKFPLKRRSPFGFARLLPSLFASQEEQDQIEQKIMSTTCQTPDENEEKNALLGCLTQIEKLNNWLGHIVGRVGQFLQG